MLVCMEQLVTDTNLIIAILFIVILPYLVYKCSTTNFNYWKDRNVSYIEPLPLFGNFWKVITLQLQIGHFLAELYNQFDTPYFGMFIFHRPYLVLKSPELIKSILVRDFTNFSDRTILADEKCDPMGSKFLFFVKNPEWKIMRTKIAPVFSTGKLKNMVTAMKEVSDDMNMYIERNLNNSIDVKELFAKYATDVITSCALGIKANSFKFEDAEFRKYGKLIFDFRLKTSIIQTFSFTFHSLVKAFRLAFFDTRYTNFVRKVFWEIYNERKRNSTKRNDIVDAIIQIKETWRSDVEGFEFDGDRIPAQAAHFFAAGFETISSTMAFALYELCLNPVIKSKLRDEIKSSLLKHGQLSYEALTDMAYLDMVLYETLRKYPALPFVDRTCHEDYKLPHDDLVIEKGTPVYISVFGLHYDPKYFPDPEKFDPDRFSDENKDSFPEFAFLPFGKGPRTCIGERFGFTSSKLGLARILLEFDAETNEETPIPIGYETRGFLLASKAGLPMKFKKLNC